jgi:hypothetical protein
LEDVFLRVAEAAEAADPDATPTVTDEDTQAMLDSSPPSTSWCRQTSSPPNAKLAKVKEDGSYTGELVAGRLLQWQRYKAVILKRFHNVRRDYKAFLSQIVLPAVFICLGMVVATSFPPPADRPPLELAPIVFNVPCNSNERATITPVADVSSIDPVYASVLAQGVWTGGFDTTYFTDVSNSSVLADLSGNVSQYILDTFDALQSTRRAAVSFEDAVNPVVQFSSSLLNGQIDNLVARGT